MNKKLLATVLLALVTCAGLYAQGVTTATFIGFIKDANGTVMPGANIIAVHQPSGTQYGTTARADGRYVIPNARVGGPYKLSVTFLGYKTQEKDGLFLELGNTTNVDFAMSEDAAQLAEVVVSGSVDPVMNSGRTGASTNISNRVITRLPTISRSFNDYVRMTPQANGNGFAGRSDGYNNITIDGALFNNAFGLSGTVGGQTNAQPISLDAVDQITTSIAPYDVTQGSFTGAGVNVVTRSGTNDVVGSVYYFTRNQNLVGSNIAGASNPYSDFAFSNMGARLGAPIIKNKLFFFSSYERERQTVPGTTFSAATPSDPYVSGGTVSQVNASTLDSLSNFLSSNYSYNAGPFQNYNLAQNSDKVTFKIDWNISTKHKFAIKYNYLKSYKDQNPSNSGNLYGGRAPGQFGLPFLGAYYRINNNLNSVIAELNSTFGSGFTNKFQIGYTAFRDFRGTPNGGGVFPLVDIGNGSGQNLTSFGYEPFSANNILNTNVFQISDNFDIYKDKHTITIGTYNEFYQFENGFDPYYYGVYSYNSLADFYSSAAGNVGSIRQYQLGYSTAPDGSFPLVKVKAFQLGLYAQDKYEINSKLNVTLGLRADMPVINTTVGQNTQAAGYQFSGGAQINTSQVQKSQVLWSPRVGFNYDVKGDRTTQIRGGSGIFTGRVPYVWISNQASNNGLLFNSRQYSQANATAANLVFNPSVDAYRPGKNGNPAASASPSYNLAVTDNNFRFPQVWRTNIAIDQKLPWGVIGSLDLVYTKDINAVYHRNVNLPDPTFNANGADNRPVYYKTFPSGTSNSTANTRINPNVTDAILMSNTNKGYSYFGTVQFKKAFSNGLDAMVAYTYTQAQSVNDGGSIAQSIWRDRQVSGNPNNNVLGYSNFLLQNRIIASLNYRKEYGGKFATSVGAFYSLAQSGRFSYVYSGDMNGDNTGGNNDLIYVPRNSSEIKLLDINGTDGSGNPYTYTAAQQWTDLDAYINQDSYLKNRRGQYAERNGGIQPWRGQLDLRVLQDFYVYVGKEKKHRNTLQLSVDIFNVGNMINNKWGVYHAPNRSNLLTFRGYDATGTPQFQYPYLDAKNKTPLTSSFRNDLGLLSRWQMQLGVRYIFD
ncbi:MAG: TonB-dependent receptor [Bacteroidetes bacterium]|nr:TonB-dependent receptor [Bacteroidota bacterium]